MTIWPSKNRVAMYGTNVTILVMNGFYELSFKKVSILALNEEHQESSGSFCKVKEILQDSYGSSFKKSHHPALEKSLGCRTNSILVTNGFGELSFDKALIQFLNEGHKISVFCLSRTKRLTRIQTACHS